MSEIQITKHKDVKNLKHKKEWHEVTIDMKANNNVQ